MTEKTYSEKKAEEDNRDYNNEIAGHSVGRIKRFLSKTARDSLEERKGKKSREGLSFLDILLLTDPVYAALYADVMERIEEIDKAIIKTLASLDKRISILEKRMTDIEDRAYRLNDGTRVYRGKNDEAYTENGHVLSTQETSTITWQSHNASWKERHTTSAELDHAYHKKEGVKTYRDDVLQGVKERMSDPHNRPDKEELRDTLDMLDKKFPDDLQVHMNTSDNTQSQSGFLKHFQIKMEGKTDETETLSPSEQAQTEHAIPFGLSLNPMSQT
ncbi:MAG: hypothetical protein KAI61_02880 [Alphaproteobacteria bacterium]|nr:hypothetical protein [Alphaproteobacteria bacterium]MCK5555205.1 hypothetical protein [Alphaproteobacteria bacterium]